MLFLVSMVIIVLQIKRKTSQEADLIFNPHSSKGVLVLVQAPPKFYESNLKKSYIYSLLNYISPLSQNHEP